MSRANEDYTVLDLPYTPLESPDTLKKCFIPYKKLVVPVRMRSVYWKYFGFPADQEGSIITKDKIVCIVCKNQMVNNHNTSNLRMHLTSKHKNIMAKIDPTALIQPLKSARQRKPKDRGNRSDHEFDRVTGGSMRNDTREVQVLLSEEGNERDISDIAIVYPNDGAGEYNRNKVKKEPAESNEMTDTIVNFIVSDLISPEIVDGPGFHCLVSNLSSKAVVIPNEKKLVSDIIPTLFNARKEQLYSSMQMNSLNNLSLSMEEWTCANSVKCISIYVHFTQNTEAVLKTRLLRTICYAGSETISYWAGILDRLFQEWLIDVNFVTAVIVSFNNDSLLKAIKGKNLLTVPCFMFVIQQMCDEFCFHHHLVGPMLKKCRKLVKYLQDNRIEFQENMIISDSVNSLDEEDGFEYSFGSDRRDLWLTTYFMLKSLIRRKNTIEEAVLNLDRELIYVIPSEDEWKMMTDIVSLLEPLKTIVITLFEEKNLLISLLKPLLWKVCSSTFESSDKDSNLMQELKKQIKQMLNDVYNEQEVNNLTQIATLLDPRFKNFLQDEGGMDVEATLIELLTNFVNVEGASSPKLSAAEDYTPKKSSRVSGFNLLLGNICPPKPTLTLKDRLKAEINHYQSQSSAALEESPLDWWCQMSNKCPNMNRLAFRYHCIPAVVTHSGNYSLLEYVKFHQKRSALNVDVADALLFLHSNKNAL